VRAVRLCRRASSTLGRKLFREARFTAAGVPEVIRPVPERIE
jgi:hypothetical protein